MVTQCSRRVPSCLRVTQSSSRSVLQCLFDTSFLVQQPRYRQGREAKTAKASRHTKDKHSSTIYRGEASEGGPHILLDKHRSFTQTAGKSRFTVELYSTSSRPQRAEAGKHTLRWTRLLSCWFSRKKCGEGKPENKLCEILWALLHCLQTIHQSRGVPADNKRKEVSNVVEVGCRTVEATPQIYKNKNYAKIWKCFG